MPRLISFRARRATQPPAARRGSGGSRPRSRIGGEGSRTPRPAATALSRMAPPPAPPTEAELGTALSRMAPPPTMEAELTRSATTIDALPAEMLTEVLLRVSTPAALVNAAAVSRSWRGAIATPAFLSRYRERHTSSTFLGLYVPREFAGPPLFHIPDSIRLGGDDARHLKDAARRASDFGETRRYQDHRLHDADAFILGSLLVHRDCRLLDCHNSRLLLTRGKEALEVRSPLARESILLPFPPDVVNPYRLQACLLHGHDKAPAAAFRVVCLQHRLEGRSRQARAVEYDSTRKSWQDHPWETIKSSIEGTPEKVMHAGDRIFCKYTGLTPAALVLDTSSMQFSVLTLPSYQRFVIGEREDNVCCFVAAVGCSDHRFKVWELDEKKLDWDLKEDIEMKKVLGGRAGYYRPRAISNGIALLCSKTKHHHFVVDLKTCSMKEKFEFHGQSAYPMQMPWPPVFSDLTANAAGGFDRDGGPASVGDARIGVACRVHGGSATNGFDDGGLAKLSVGDADADTRTGARGSGEIDAPSPGPSVGGCAGTNPLPEAKAARLLHSSSIACFVPSSSTAPSALMDLMTAGLTSCPHQGKKRAGSRQSKGSPKAMGPVRRNWKRKPKPLKAIGQRRRHIFSIASKISEVQIATSSCRETSAASTVSILGGSGSTLKFTDVGTQPIIDVSITGAPSLSDPSAGESGEQRDKAAQDSNEPQDIDIQDPTATPTSATTEQSFGKDKNYVSNDYLIPDICDPFSDLMNPKAAGGSGWVAGPASVGDSRTGSGELDTIEDLFSGTLAMSPPAAPAVEPEEPLIWRSRSPFCVQSLDNDLPLQPPALASCPQQGRKRADSRESEGSPEAKGPGRRNWKRPKYLEAIFDLRRRQSSSITSKISDEVQIATSSCSEASEASTAAVSAGECKLLFGGSGSTLKLTDVGKQPISDVSITRAPSLSDPGESAEQRGAAAQDSNEPQDIDIQPTATAPTSATTEQSFGKDKNYVSYDYLTPDICDPFSHLMNPKGPASVGDTWTGSGSDTVEDLFVGTLAMARPVEPLIWRSRSPFSVHSPDNDLLLQPPALASCPQQGRKRADSRESKGSPEAKGPRRRNWKRKPKYVEAIFDLRRRLRSKRNLRRRHLSSIALKISDEVQIVTSSFTEESAASTAAVGSTFTDSGKQPIIDVSITNAPSDFYPSGELTEQRGKAARDKGSPEPMGRGRHEKKLNPKYVGGDRLFDDDCHRSPPPRSAPPKDTFPTYSHRRRRFAVTMAAEWEGKNPAGGGGGDNPQHQQAVLQADPAQEAGGHGTGLELEEEKANRHGQGGGTGDKDDVEDPEEVMGLATFCLDFGKNPEPESGRCRQTNGKNWRCSRNIIPNEKYCRRHMGPGSCRRTNGNKWRCSRSTIPNEKYCEHHMHHYLGRKRPVRVV